MNFIEEQRKFIEEGNNEANNEGSEGQTKLFDFLENLDPQLSSIEIREPLSGTIDLTILTQCHFTNITSLSFVKGNITSIINIPEGIQQFSCPQNLLVEIPELPSSLIYLNLFENGIQRSNTLGSLTELKELNVSNNQLVLLENLPKNLEILKCENNSLRTLDLEGLNNLKALHCSGNPILTIEHLPENIVDLQMENNPIAQITREKERVEGQERPKEKEQEQGSNGLSFTENLLKYFEMKSNYENKLYDKKKEVYRKAAQEGNKKKARKMVQQVKPVCVNCNRPVGTLFKTHDRHYIARCGDETNPCSLNIKLFAGEYENLNYLLQFFRDSVEIHKEDIIKHKLNILFQLLGEKEGLKFFNKEFKEYSESEMFLKELMNEYNSIYFNEEKQEKINKKMTQINKIQEEMNELIDHYKQTNNKNNLHDALQKYINELMPERKNLQILKYPTMEMELDIKSGKHVLYQKGYTIHQVDFNII